MSPAPDESIWAGYGCLCERGNSNRQLDLLRLIHSLLWSRIPGLRIRVTRYRRRYIHHVVGST